jgi:hypothetical protein
LDVKMMLPVAKEEERMSSRRQHVLHLVPCIIVVGWFIEESGGPYL